MLRSCHNGFRPGGDAFYARGDSPTPRLFPQVGLIEEVDSSPPSAGNRQAESAGCEAATERIQSVLAGLRWASDDVRAATGHVRGDSASCDQASDIYISDRESYELPGRNYDAFGCNCNGHSS